jgi:hypothetical protein
MKNCSLFLPTQELEIIAASINKAFDDCTVEFNATVMNWTQVKVSKKTGWFGKSSITMHVRSFHQPNEFVPMIQGMMNFVGQLPAQNPKVQHKLMTKIQNTKSSLGIVASASYDAFSDGIFQVINDLDGFAFVDGTSWISPQQQLILNTAGQSEVTDLNVPDSDVQLGVADAAASEELFTSQIERKQRSISYLKSKNVPTIEHLPCIVADEEAQIREKTEIVKRMIAVTIAAIKGEGVEEEIVQTAIKMFDAQSFFSPEELAFIQTKNPSNQERVKFSWRYEGLWVLLWALDYVKTLEFPSHICDVPAAVGFLREAGSFENMLNNTNLKSKASILDEADLIYRMNWACVSARIKNQAAPAGLDAGVVYERHYALNWLICYQIQDWDTVRTDT